MKKLVIAATLFMLCSFAFYLLGNIDIALPLLIASLIGLAIGVRKQAFWSGFSFSIWIAAAVVTSLSYPAYFTNVGEFKTEWIE